jgi:Tol biopolymer transport system component
MRPSRRVRPSLALSGFIALGWMGACLADPGGPEVEFPAGLVVSNPVAPLGAHAAQHAHALAGAGAAETVVFVSLPPGTIPNGGLATIRNARTGSTVAAAMAAGGFDPVPLEARAGDGVTITVILDGGGTQILPLTVPAARRPIVVRTNPPPRKRDVPLNSVVVVVFSEPIDPAAAARISLLQGGAPVGGRAVLSADGLRASFEPDQFLAANTEYVLSVPTSVVDVSGDSLEQAVQTQFSVGTTTAVARVVTEQSALFTNPFNNAVRTLDMDATLRSDGSVTGEFRIFYPDSGWFNIGRVTCFSIVDGNKAWVAGVVDSTRNPQGVGAEFGWRIVDHGPTQGGVPDQLSLAYPLQLGVLGTPQDFCANTPLIDPSEGEILLHDLVSGDIVVTGTAPPDTIVDTLPPLLHPADGLSQVAFFSPYGAIMVITADKNNDNLRTRTSGPNDFNPAWSWDGNKLAFQSDRTQQNNWDIYTINWDGTGFTHLTSGPATDQDPAWSHDGTQIAFLRNGSIHVMNADGSGVTRVSFAGVDSHPSWSPDGSRIVFASSRSGTNAIYVMNVDGGGVVQLTDAARDYSPTWSPDGTKIAFARKTDPPNEGAYLINPDGSGLTRLTQGINGHASWSPDGNMLVYELFGITVVNADGTGMRRWFSGGFNPVWSPVGSVPAAPVAFRSIEKVSGDSQSGVVRDTLAQQLRVRVVDDGGTPQPGVTVRWNVWGPGAGIGVRLGPTSTTDSGGYTSVWVTLGNTAGAVRMRAAVVDGTARRAEIVFTATAIQP